MTAYATHRFSVGQRVVRLVETSTPCEVLALMDGADGPEYRIKSDRNPEAVVAERDLTYAPVSARIGRRPFSVH
jgi:hypothetical protein